MSTDVGPAVERGTVDPKRGDSGELDASIPPTDGPGVIAELHLDHERLLLRPTLRRLDDVTIEPDYRARQNGHVYQFVSISTADIDVLEAALEHDPTVRNPVLVDYVGDQLVYRVELTDETITFSGTIADQGGRISEARGTATAWILQLRFPSRDALVAFNDACKRHDVSVQVTHLRSTDGTKRPLLGLTKKQQELLTVAYEEGYFDVPRGISQDELADRLGVSKSAISQRLRRAMTELCATSLSP